MRITDEADIGAPAEVVWRLTEDIENWPATTPTVTRVERLDAGPLGAGSRARVEQPGLPAKVWTVTRFEHGSHFEWETAIYGVRFTGRHHLEATSNGCRNTLVLDLTGRGARLLGSLAGRKLRKSLATENAGFKNRAEAEVNSSRP
jgi:uncharacterized membrane protein